MTPFEWSQSRTLPAPGELAEAEIAATEKNASKVVEHLKAAGQWRLDVAKAIGKDVALAAIKKEMEME